jgi:hypothetical protein
MCVACPEHAHLAPGTGALAHAPSACRCDAGYSGDAASGGLCVPCASGSFKTLIGPGTCTSCGAHAFSPSASKNQTACECAAPLWEDGPDGVSSEGFDCQSSCTPGTTKGASECEPCQPETYKPTTGPDACTPCPSPANASLAGSVSAANCTCRAGEIGLAEADYRVVTLGAFSATEDLVCTSTCTHTGFFASLSFTGPGPVLVHLQRGPARLLVFSCEHDCAALAGAAIPLASPLTAFHAELRATLYAGTTLTLARHTERAVEPLSFAGLPLAAFAVARRLATGDHVFADAPTRVQHRCAPCPPGLVCH